MTPTAKITMFHSSLPVEGLVVENPIGFDTAVISLFRHQDFHSLVEGFKGNFMWFGTAMKTVKQIEGSFGPNAIVLFHFDVSFKTGVFVNLFKGMFKLWQLEEIIIADRQNYKLTLPLLQNDFWSKFITRLDSPVNLEGTTDLDGGTRVAINKIVLPMPSQKLQLKFQGRMIDNKVSGVDFDFAEDDFIQLPFSELVTLNEIPDRFNPIFSVAPFTPVNLFTFKYPGTYSIDFSVPIRYHKTDDIGDEYKDLTGKVKFVLKVGATTIDIEADPQTYEDTPVYGAPDYDEVVGTKDTIVNFFRYTGDINALAGDQLSLYGVIEDLSGISGAFASMLLITEETVFIDFGVKWWEVLGEDAKHFLNVTGNTTFTDTETDAYLIKDAAESIISKIVGQDNAVKSDYLDTCKGHNAIFRGKHLRGHDFSSKEFAMSFDEWLKGAGPLLFLGLGMTEVAGVKKIEIEDIPHFYDPVPAVNISNLNRLVRRYDLERVYKSIEVGYNKWSSESDGGIDDPQTKRIFNTDFISEGVKKSVLCSWMAASLAIERSRRNRIELGKDDRNDEEIMVVALVPDGDDWLPEFGTVFNAITNLINSDFRINIRHSATRIFKRWKSWFNGCMVYSDTGLFAFSRGEGNYQMTSQFETTDCESTDDPEPVLDEGANISADTDNKIFVPQIWEAQGVPMSFSTYQDVVANKNKALGVSRTDADHVPMHILDLGWEIFKSESNMILLQATEEGL